jgi:uncharacterized protein with NRDE domain
MLVDIKVVNVDYTYNSYNHPKNYKIMLKGFWFGDRKNLKTEFLDKDKNLILTTHDSRCFQFNNKIYSGEIKQKYQFEKLEISRNNSTAYYSQSNNELFNTVYKDIKYIRVELDDEFINNSKLIEEEIVKYRKKLKEEKELKKKQLEENPVQFKDMVGQEIRLDDYVLVSSRDSIRLKKAIVIGFTNTNVKIKFSYNGYKNQIPETCFVIPNNQEELEKLHTSFVLENLTK